MQLTPVVCSQCGAPLEVPAGVNFVTCGHCHVALAVKREVNVIYTEVLEQLDRKTDRLAEEVALLRYRDAVEDIDEQWQRHRDKAMIRDKWGNKHEPSEANVVILAIILGVVLTVGSGGALASGSPNAILPVLLIAGGGAAYCVYAWYHVQSYRRAERSYRRRKQALKIEDFVPRDE